MIRLHGIKLIMAVGLMVILSLAGCTSPTPAPNPTPTPTPAPTPAPTPTPSPAPVPTPTSTGPYGELRIALGTLGGESFDPAITSGTEILTQEVQIFDMLVRAEGTKLQPDIAERWEMAPDAKSYTLYIRKGIKFHNGEELTADDVKFSIERYMSPVARIAETRNMVDRVEKIDDYTIRVYCKGAQPFYLDSVVSPLGRLHGVVIPKDYFEKVGVDYFSKHPIGSGPFRFVRHVIGDMLEYEALDKHWRQTAAFKKLSIIKIPEESTRTALPKVGQADVISLQADNIEEVEKAGSKVATLTAEQALIILNGNYQPEVRFPTSDVKVRQALSLAINRGELITLLFHGKAMLPGPHPVHSVSADIDIPYWMDYAAKAYRYDLEEAKRLLKEAGYAAGFSLKFYVSQRAQEPYWPKLSEVIQSYWAKIGVKADLVPVDYEVIRAKRNLVKAPDPTWMGVAFTTATGQARVPAAVLRNNFHSGGDFAPFGRAMPELDKMIDDALSEIDPVKRKKLTDEGIKIITDSYVPIMLLRVPTLFAIGPRVDFALPPPPTMGPIGYYVDTAKHKQ